jgi:hypothetical protein
MPYHKPPRPQPFHEPAPWPREGEPRIWDPDYISPIGKRERIQKETGNPAERRTKADRINREDAHYRGGFPVAGHGEPEPANDPAPRRRPRMRR